MGRSGESKSPTTWRAIKFGRTLCPVEVNLFDEADRHVAVAQVTYMLLGDVSDR